MQGPNSDSTGGGSRRKLLIVIAALVPLIPIIVGVILTSGKPAKSGVSAQLSPFATSQATTPVPPVTPAPAHVHKRPSGQLIALLRHATTMRLTPRGRTLAPQPITTTFGSPVVLLVRRTVRGWLGVLSPLAGNGKLGWIPMSAVSLRRVQWKIEVSLSHRRVTVLDHGKVIKRYTVAIGRPTAPTPTGFFAVTDRLATHDPSGPYGCCILALSAESPHAIQGWSGGNRIAIHSTPETSSIGLPVSHGCMRLTLPEGQWLIDHVPLGTPTEIRT